MRDQDSIDIVIEISLGSNLKYEKCKKTGMLRCDRILHSPYVYPFNYGYFPGTLTGVGGATPRDGDELDAVLMTKYPLVPNSMIECKIIGALKTKDEKGFDDKIICVPASSVDPEFKKVTKLADLEESERDMIEYFFRNYKHREYKKFVEIIGFVEADEAKLLYKKAVKDFLNKKGLPCLPDTPK